MISPLKLYFKWGINFEEEYRLPDKTARVVSYKERDELIRDVELKYPQKKKEFPPLEFDESEDDFEENAFSKKKNIRTGDDEI